MALTTFQFLNQIFIASEIVFFNIFGLFGNLNFIFLTATKTKLKSKSSYLQCALCFSHIICLSFELPNAGLLFTGIQLKRNQCFPAISIYIFFICAQAVIILMMTLDIFIIVFFPAFYQTVTTWKYLTGMLTIPVVYSSGIVIWGFLAMDDEIVMFCNPPLALYHTVSRFWTFSNVIINTITLVLFISLILLFYYKGKKQKSDTRKIMKRLKVSILFFIFTWYIGLLAADLFVALGFTGPTLIFMMSNLVFFVLISYSQFFYVVIWRSPEYRNAFFEAWSCIPCCAGLKEKHIMSTKISATAHSHQAASTVSST
ncbi:Protein CBR-SRSX-5 [Caenorhabditis briggsae]|uniref:Protein CBR-SRSX-5 n=1 Tax=Caenorhabditis briggsae TaxID=6238 RepID=A8X6Y3_CAEBR|nr:Protein CBR-SRSX-5 [Caenorhabditis briggsae]CAP28394.1 Protein CBR-SRSX-5 [Caenorhabditis briggsae]